jgi:UV DNA damage repair endonuclease
VIKSEFATRIETQRQALRTVNSISEFKEPLFGFSKGAIDRWLNINKFLSNEKISLFLYRLSSQIFCLSNKSQQPITDDYKEILVDIDIVLSNLVSEIKNVSH